jgi:hypothetical protein
MCRGAPFVFLLITVLSGCAAADPEAGDSLLGETWEIEAADTGGVIGTILIERGEIRPMPAGQVFDNRTHAILVEVTYVLDRPSADGHGSIDWRFDASGDPNDPIFDEGQANLLGNGFGPMRPTLGVVGPGDPETVEPGWVTLSISRAHLTNTITLTYRPTGEAVVIYQP